jgi:hypothetical protein
MLAFSTTILFYSNWLLTASYLLASLLLMLVFPVERILVAIAIHFLCFAKIAYCFDRDRI